MRKIQEGIADPAGVAKSGRAPVTRTPDKRPRQKEIRFLRA